MYRHILIAHGTRVRNQSLQLGLDLAKRHQARVTALHVIGWFPQFAVVSPYDPIATRDSLVGHGNVIVDSCRESMKAENVVGDVRMIDAQDWGQTVSRTITRCAAEVGADFIVVGSRRRGWRLFSDDVVGGVLKIARVPVIVAGQPDRSDVARGDRDERFGLA